MERISLSNATFEGNSNAYLFGDGSETVLVDTGDWTAQTQDQLEAGLADNGVGFVDIDHVLLTHWHPDHTGLAGEIQSAGGATVHVHAADEPLVRGDSDARAALEAAHERCFEAWKIPAADRDELWSAFRLDESRKAVPSVTTIEDGTTLTIGGQRVRAVHSPGHTAGHCLFEFGETEVFSGDALLPVYTPNVGGADVRVDRPLRKYLETLRAIADAGYRRAWAGHRGPVDDPAGRARGIIRHHEERAYRVLNALGRLGPCSVWTVGADLFGELSGIHILHGPGECYAHLEHLEADGLVASEDDEYRLADGATEKLRRREDERWPLEV